MTYRALPGFKAYDVPGRTGIDLDRDVAYRDGRAVTKHFAAEVASGVMDAGADVLWLGIAGTEENYWTFTEFGESVGIEVKASHNPIDYNGLKTVRPGSRTLD